MNIYVLEFIQKYVGIKRIGKKALPWILVISSKNLGQGTLTTSPKVALGQQVRPSQSLAHPEKKGPLNKETHREHHTAGLP